MKSVKCLHYSAMDLTVSYELEALPPEDNTLVQAQTYPFQEQRVLQSRKMLQVAVLPQLAMQVAHAEWEVFTQAVNASCVDAGHVTDA